MIELWYEALASDYGIVVETNDRRLCRERLYHARRTAGDPDLDQISIIVPSIPNELWLVRTVHAARPPEGD